MVKLDYRLGTYPSDYVSTQTLRIVSGPGWSLKFLSSTCRFPPSTNGMNHLPFHQDISAMLSCNSTLWKRELISSWRRLREGTGFWQQTSALTFFADHSNLGFQFNPTAVVADLSLITLRNFLRWAVGLSSYNYVCVQISGLYNVQADILSRWRPPQVFSRLVTFPCLPSYSSEDFLWPSAHELSTLQSSPTHFALTPPSSSNIDGLIRTVDGEIWISDVCSDLQIRLCSMAHLGPAGHRALKATAEVLRHSLYWSTLSSDVATFARSCIHCVCWQLEWGKCRVGMVPPSMALNLTICCNLTILRFLHQRKERKFFWCYLTTTLTIASCLLSLTFWL